MPSLDSFKIFHKSKGNGRVRKLNNKIISLDNLSPSLHRSKKRPKRVSKSSAYVVQMSAPKIQDAIEERKRLRNDNLIQRDEADEFLGSIEAGDMEGDASQLVKDLKKIKRVRHHYPQHYQRGIDNDDVQIISDETPRIDIDDELREMEKTSNKISDRDIFDDSKRREEVKLKYTKAKPDFHPKPLDRQSLMKLVKNHQILLEGILDGNTQSYFYSIAKRYSENSHRPKVSDMDLISVPKGKYYGYIGPKRGHQLSGIITKKLKSALRSKAKHSKVIRFWGLDNFTLYVLVPELIARVVRNDNELSSLDEAYKLMEDTNDYGIYVMDSIDN